LTAIPGKEAEVEALLRSVLRVAQEEPATIAWYALRFDSSTFGIFNAFPNDDGLERHLYGHVGAVLAALTSELFVQPPSVEKMAVLAAKY